MCATPLARRWRCWGLVGTNFVGFTLYQWRKHLRVQCCGNGQLWRRLVYGFPARPPTHPQAQPPPPQQPRPLAPTPTSPDMPLPLPPLLSASGGYCVCTCLRAGATRRRGGRRGWHVASTYWHGVPSPGGGIHRRHERDPLQQYCWCVEAGFVEWGSCSPPAAHTHCMDVPVISSCACGCVPR